MNLSLEWKEYIAKLRLDLKLTEARISDKDLIDLILEIDKEMKKEKKEKEND